MRIKFKEAEVIAYFLLGFAGMIISFVYSDISIRIYSLLLLAISRILMEIEGWSK